MRAHEDVHNDMPGHAYRVPGHNGSEPDEPTNDPVETARRASASVSSHDVHEPGDSSCVPANSHVSAPGTTETSSPIDRV